jgi:hypothetical protein
VDVLSYPREGSEYQKDTGDETDRVGGFNAVLVNDGNKYRGHRSGWPGDLKAATAKRGCD